MTRISISTPEKVLKQAKSLAYRDVHIPKNLREKVDIKVSSEKVTIITKKK
jgi:hypothetical protein